jgi:hypothetical protein
MPDDDDVGYCRPPKHKRFKPGESGNPKGRLKGARNLRTDLLDELAQQVRVSEGSRKSTVSKQRALLKGLIAKAIKGDARAANSLFNLFYRVLPEEILEQAHNDPPPEDKLILERFIKRQQTAPHREPSLDPFEPET